MKHFCFYFFISFLIIGFKTRATHIVGGEIELVRTNTVGATHILSLNLYFDAINGDPRAEDPNTIVFVFRKRDNLLMGSASLPKVANNEVVYQNPACGVIGGLKTRLIRYADYVFLDPTVFNDAGGYYIVWERCCRNNVISNIIRPEAAGMTFYLEFAALRKNGEDFINSSPTFSPNATDYLCINQPFKMSMAGNDSDGDVLVYSLKTPINGFSTSAVPSPVTATGSFNYPLVRFLPGISEFNMIPGNIPLQINEKTGEISVTPSRLGLYVFGVQVEEYRKGVLIGMQRRDFQLKVVDCPINNKPRVFVKDVQKAKILNQNETIILDADGAKCLNLLFTDNSGQDLSWKIISQNFDAKNVVLSNNKGRISNQDSLISSLCFNQCAATNTNKFLEVQVAVTDNGCPIPLADTIKLRVQIQPKVSSKPTIKTTLVANRVSIDLNKTLTFNVLGNDADNSNLILEVKGVGFNLADVGMVFQGGNFLGLFNQPFTWTPNCQAFKFKQSYQVVFYVSKLVCETIQKDSVLVQLNIVPPTNNSPILVSSQIINPTVVVLDPTNLKKIEVNVKLSDPDLDQQLSLTANGQGFDLKILGFEFQNKTGKSPLTSVLTWTPDCKILKLIEGKEISIDFIGQDDSCLPNASVTVVNKFLLKSPMEAFIKNLPNVITPNNDGKNDYFSINDLPTETCDSYFLSVKIFNRWGSLVFESNEKTFRWLAEKVIVGSYFYELNYTNKQYKGEISILK